MRRLIAVLMILGLAACEGGVGGGGGSSTGVTGQKGTGKASSGRTCEVSIEDVEAHSLIAAKAYRAKVLCGLSEKDLEEIYQ